MNEEKIDFNKPLVSKTNLFPIMIPVLLIPGFCVFLFLGLVRNDQQYPLPFLVGFGILIAFALYMFAQLKRKLTLYPDKLQINGYRKYPIETIPFSEIIYLTKYKLRYNRSSKTYWVIEFHTQSKSYSYSQHDFENVLDIYKYLEHYLPNLEEPEIVYERKKAGTKRAGMFVVTIGLSLLILALVKFQFQQPSYIAIATLVTGVGIGLIITGNRKN